MTTPKYNRDTIITDLKENVIEVFFRKVDGTMRLLRCTLKPNMLPDIPANEGLLEQHRTVNPNLVVAWDIENGAWRSFRTDSIEYLQLMTQDL